MAQCATTALAVAASSPCVRGARGRFGGFGPVPGVLSLLFPPSRPACPALRVAGCPVRLSLTPARWYAIARGLCVPRARSGCPSGSPRVPFACVCARAPAASAPPPPLGGVACAPRAVPALGAGRAVPRGLCPSACPAPVPCSVWRAWGGGRSGPGSPVLDVRRCPSPGRPSSVAGSHGSATRLSRVRLVRAWGPSTGPTACAPAGRRCLLWGRRKGVPGGGAFHHCEGRLRSGAVPPPTARPLGGLLCPATHVLWARVCGCGGPTLSPWPPCPVGAACRGGGGGPCLGGVACHRCGGRLVSGAVHLRSPVLWSGQPGFRYPCVPGAVDAGVGTQHRAHSVRLCGPALLPVAVAEGRPRGGCLPPF